MSSFPEISRVTRLALRLVAAKQDIVQLGFPEIISTLLYEKYGKLAPLIAKWYKGYRASGSYAENPDWWRIITQNWREEMSLATMTHLYEATTDPESFLKAVEWAGITLKTHDASQELVDDWRRRLVPMIREKFFDETFFTYYRLMQDITSGKLTDVATYKRLDFVAAAVKYDKRHHFEETTPLKVYSNGFKWIDTGKKSTLLSNQMKNCGSSGVMGIDPDRTILTLFGPNNKPHVMVVYSPNEKRISGDECAGSSPVKPEYHDYVLDLAHHLGAWFDAEKSKSTLLALKYRLRDKAQAIEPLQTTEHSFDEYFRFEADGQTFYTDGYVVVSDANVRKMQNMVERGEMTLPYPQEDPFKSALIQANRNTLIHQGIEIVRLYEFAKE